MWRTLTALLGAIVTSLVVVTYFADLPRVLMPAHESLVREYYWVNMFPNMFLDVLFILAYLAIPLFAKRRLTLSITQTMCVVAIVTACLTTVACALFRMRSLDTSNFFSKWFHAVGYKAVVYDVMLVTAAYAVYERLARL